MTLALLLVLAQPFPNVMSVRNPTASDGGVRALSVNSSAADPAHVVLEGFDAGFTVTGVVIVSNMPPPPKRNPLTGAAKVDGSGSVQPISATSLPLPTGAATEATLSQLGVIAANQTNGAQAVRVANQPPAPARNLAGAALVDGSRSTQPVSILVLPLPTGAAQEAGGNLDAIRAALLSQPFAAAVTFVQSPINPFLQRCNPVRRSNCQP